MHPNTMRKVFPSFVIFLLCITSSQTEEYISERLYRLGSYGGVDLDLYWTHPDNWNKIHEALEKHPKLQEITYTLRTLAEYCRANDICKSQLATTARQFKVLDVARKLLQMTFYWNEATLEPKFSMALSESEFPIRLHLSYQEHSTTMKVTYDYHHRLAFILPLTLRMHGDAKVQLSMTDPEISTKLSASIPGIDTGVHGKAAVNKKGLHVDAKAQVTSHVKVNANAKVGMDEDGLTAKAAVDGQVTKYIASNNAVKVNLNWDGVSGEGAINVKLTDNLKVNGQAHLSVTKDAVSVGGELLVNNKNLISFRWNSQCFKLKIFSRSLT